MQKLFFFEEAQLFFVLGVDVEWLLVAVFEHRVGFVTLMT